MGVSAHAPIHSNSLYVQIFIRYIYKTRQPKHPHLPISRYQQHPQGTASLPHYRYLGRFIGKVQDQKTVLETLTNTQK